MSVRPHDDDRGVLAVRRVRSVREADSRFGLQQAVAERREAGVLVSDLRRRLNQASTESRSAVAATTAGFLAGRASLLAISAALGDAEQAWETSRTVTDAARSQWQVDHTRLSAIDLLLDRRAAERRTETLRREARDSDEIAAERWLRAREAALAASDRGAP